MCYKLFMIQVNNISKAFGGQVLFEDISFNLPPKAKVGLVGRNGSGKSTIFKLILGEESLDVGEISIPKNYTIGTLKQHLEFTQPTVKQECYQVLREGEKFETYRVDKILSGLGFSTEDFDKDPLSFSGGYQIRINLAKLLATNPNLLLLDEPTNYLDIVSLRWLKNFLNNFSGEVIIITHDQEFMDSVTTHTMGLHRKSLKLISGDTAKFYEQLIQEEEIYEKTRINHEKRKKELERFVDRFRAKASKATQAQSKLKQLQKMESMDELANESNLEFNFNYSDLGSKNLLKVNDLSFGYQNDTPLFQGLSFEVKKGDCIGIIGKNGKGKSTLLNCIAGELNPAGEVQFHPEAKLAHFGQTNISRLFEGNTIVNEVEEVAPDLGSAKIRQICGTMMFPGELADKKIKVLSGGERSRVMLGKIIAKPSNLLLLDEPTNHLDMQSIESLSEAIEEFSGGSIIVTHSEMLLKRLVNKLVIFHQDKAEFFLGSYQDFLDKIGWEEETTTKTESKANKLTKKEIQRLRNEIIQERSKILKPLKKIIDKLEEQITTNEELLDKNSNLLIKASEDGDGEAITKLSQEISALETKIEEDFESLSTNQQEHDEHFEKFEQQLNELASN